MLMRLQGTASHPIPSLTYGSSTTNAYIQIAKILEWATTVPPSPAPEQRVPIVPPAKQEQRVLQTAPLKLVSPPRRPGTCHSQQIANLQPKSHLAQAATPTGP
jgi:hypothetical protein